MLIRLQGQFGINVNPGLITVAGRILPSPRVTYKNEKLDVQFASWNMAGVQCSKGSSMKTWTYLVISMPSISGSQDAFNNLDSVGRTVGELRTTLQNMGVSAPAPIQGSRVVLKDPNDVALEQVFQRATTGKMGIKLLLVILPSKNAIVYNRVKHLGDVKFGLHTICSVSTNFTKSNVQKFANIALKFNLKLGGTNQMVENPKLGLLNEGKTMVVGIDVTHPSLGSPRIAPSVAGMVASIESFLGQWPADLRIQERRKEMVTDLDSMLKSRLRLWKTLGGHTSFPENLLFYRDGVSEGQYQSVLDIELPLLRQACAEVYPPEQTKKGLPNISIIIIGKRHHTHFYPTKSEDADRSANPKNGTVVDRGVTEARNWDFYLQAHTALQGTARPAHYYILLDEIFSKRKISQGYANVADYLEDLTHSMCYGFGRATKAVSLCPPAYYADIVCERTRCYLTELFDMRTPSGTPAGSLASGGQGGREWRMWPCMRI